MEDADLTDGNLLSDKMKINLHMLRALMLNGVGGEVHDADVVAVDESAVRWRSLELMQELAQPGGLSHTIGDDTVLGFGAGAGDDSLPLGRPGDQETTVPAVVSRVPTVETVEPDSQRKSRSVGLGEAARGKLSSSKTTC
jgi:hypothetical protein